MKSLSNSKGLTLIEVILGLAISAVIFALVLGAIRLGQRSQEKGLERQDLAQRIRIISDRLGWLVRGAYPYIYTDPENPESKELFFTGDKNSLGFVTTATDPYSDSPQDISGLKYVEISLQDDALVLKENVFFMGGDDIAEKNIFVLDPNVADIEFSYLDPSIDEKGQAGEPEWTDKWDGTEVAYLPLAVRIIVKIKNGDAEVELPPIVADIRTGGAPSTPSTSGTAPQSTSLQSTPAPGTGFQKPQSNPQ